MNHKNLLLFACTCCTLIQSSELVITSRITVNDKDQAAIVAELNADGQALTRKYADANGVRTVETTVQVTRCEVCNTGGNREETKCNCGKPRPRSEDETKCGCNRPKGEAEETKCGCNRPKGEAEETKCGCNRPKAEGEETKCGCNRPKDIVEDVQNKCCGSSKPRPRAEGDETKCGCSRPTKDVAECADCQDHTQVTDKVTVTADGQRVCSDCNEQLRSCSSCCKDKCCKKCKKCCNKCCTSSSSTCTSCCK